MPAVRRSTPPDALLLTSSRAASMKPIDSTGLAKTTNVQTDLCIIGGGIAGISIVREFIGTRVNVCLIESGGHELDAETQALHELRNVGYPTRQNFIARARYFGGTSNLWAGRSMRLDPIDFEPRNWVPNSGWPIAFADVASHYARAENALELPATDQLQGRVDRFLSGTGADAALFRDGQLRPKLVTWGRRPLRFKKAYLKQLEQSTNVRIYLNANATEIVTSESGGRVNYVAAATLNGNELRIEARNFVLACGGLENPRLLLLSRRTQPKGLGNDHDLVGRYFMEHPRAIVGSIHLAKPLGESLLLGTPLTDGKMQIGVGPSDEIQRSERLLNSYVSLEPRLSDIALQAYESSANVVKALMHKGHTAGRTKASGNRMSEIRDLAYLLTPKEVMPHFMYRYYARLKALTHRFRHVLDLTIVNFCEQIPRADSRVYLSDTRDRLNLNTLVLDWRIAREETQSLARLQGLLAEQLSRRNGGRLEGPDLRETTPSYTDASHHIGTTRMSADPRLGVVDPSARVHGVSNLFLAGSSVFPTAGSANPTLTIVALALRLADHLKRMP
jgi:choline dehydrogenase-like flavoprotein